MYPLSHSFKHPTRMTYILWLTGGFFGFHRFFNDKWLTGGIQLGLTLCGFLQFYSDLVVIGTFHIPFSVVFFWMVFDLFLIPSWSKTIKTFSPKSLRQKELETKQQEVNASNHTPNVP